MAGADRSGVIHSHLSTSFYAPGSSPGNPVSIATSSAAELNVFMTQILRISEPVDLLGYLPHHLGFQPENSVVALSVRGPRPHIGLTMRIDIADLLDADTHASPREQLRPHLEDDGATAAILIMYSNENPATSSSKSRGKPTGTQLRKIVATLCESFDEKLPLNGFWIVTSEHYFEVRNVTGSGAVLFEFPPPDEWNEAAELSTSRAAVTAIYGGSTVAPTRDSLGEIPRAAQKQRDRAQRAALRWMARRDTDVGIAWKLESWQIWQDAIEEQLRALQGAEGAEGVTDPRVIGRLQASLEDLQIRDAVLISNIPGIGDLPTRSIASDAREEVGRSVDLILDPEVAVAPGIEAQAITELLHKIWGHCARTRVTPTLTLLAWASWWRGDGARASVLIDQALYFDPAYNMARLILRMVELGMPPGWVKREQELARVG